MGRLQPKADPRSLGLETRDRGCSRELRAARARLGWPGSAGHQARLGPASAPQHLRCRRRPDHCNTIAKGSLHDAASSADDDTVMRLLRQLQLPSALPLPTHASSRSSCCFCCDRALEVAGPVSGPLLRSPARSRLRLAPHGRRFRL